MKQDHYRKYPVVSKISDKGQLYSMDALLAMTVLIFALAMVSIITSQSVGQSTRDLSTTYFQSETQRMVATLLDGPGNPPHWETLPDRNDVSGIGLIHAAGIISSSKWNAFVDWNATDYNSLLMALNIPDRNFFIQIKDTNQNEIGRAGIAPVDNNQVSVVSVPRVYNSQLVLVTVQVFQ